MGEEGGGVGEGGRVLYSTSSIFSFTSHYIFSPILILLMS